MTEHTACSQSIFHELPVSWFLFFSFFFYGHRLQLRGVFWLQIKVTPAWWGLVFPYSVTAGIYPLLRARRSAHTQRQWSGLESSMHLLQPREGGAFQAHNNKEVWGPGLASGSGSSPGGLRSYWLFPYPPQQWSPAKCGQVSCFFADLASQGEGVGAGWPVS